MIITNKIRRRSLVVVLAMMTLGQLSLAEEKKEEASKENKFQVVNSQLSEKYVKLF